MKVKVKKSNSVSEEKIKISTEFIKLDSFLKFSAIVQTGGEAKVLISEGLVKVNGEICTQRGKKIRNGDRVVVNGRHYIAESEYAGIKNDGQ